jgi:hypothetical protein
MPGGHAGSIACVPTPPDTLTARLARAHGAALRAAYRAALPALARRRVPAAPALRCDVVAFSSQAHLPEQVVSIRSFLRHAGRPRRFRVLSDGTHTRRAAALLRAIDPCVEVALAPAAPDPMLAKLALETELGRHGPVVYADADVLFLPGAGRLAALLDEPATAPAWFLRDCEPYLDERLVTPAEAALPPVNGGVQVLFAPLDWAEPLARLPAEPVFHTEQTLLHLAMHRSGARALDPRAFVVSTDDLRAWGDAFASPALALRHYTTPVRHKLWQALRRAG